MTPSQARRARRDRCETCLAGIGVFVLTLGTLALAIVASRGGW